VLFFSLSKLSKAPTLGTCCRSPRAPCDQRFGQVFRVSGKSGALSFRQSTIADAANLVDVVQEGCRGINRFRFSLSGSGGQDPGKCPVFIPAAPGYGAGGRRPTKRFFIARDYGCFGHPPKALLLKTPSPDHRVLADGGAFIPHRQGRNLRRVVPGFRRTCSLIKTLICPSERMKFTLGRHCGAQWRGNPRKRLRERPVCC